MTIKFFLSTALAILGMATTGYADKTSKTEPKVPQIKIDKKEKAALEKAGEEAFEQGMEYRGKKEIDKAKAAFKTAAVFYKQAGNETDAERMERMAINPDAFNGTFESAMIMTPAEEAVAAKEHREASKS